MMKRIMTLLLCAVLFTGCAAQTCAHGAAEADCLVCPLEQQIEALPSPEAWLEMDLEQQNAVYTQAQNLAEQYHALPEEKQEQISNLEKLITLHETFNQQLAPAQ